MEIERIEPIPPQSDPGVNPDLTSIHPTSTLGNLDFIVGTGFNRGPNQKKRNYRLVIFCWAASLIDALLGFALAAASIVAMALLSGVHFQGLTSGWGASTSQVLLAGFVFTVGIYKVTLRIFMGYTVGEWACGLRLGNNQQRQDSSYGLRVLARFAIVFGTGVIVLPVLSLMLGHDIAGRISGLSLVTEY